MMEDGMQRTEQMANPIAASEIKWAPAPPFGRPGMEVAVLAGNPEWERHLAYLEERELAIVFREEVTLNSRSWLWKPRHYLVANLVRANSGAFGNGEYHRHEPLREIGLVETKLRVDTYAKLLSCACVEFRLSQCIFVLECGVGA
jgi:hypothetical protein